MKSKAKNLLVKLTSLVLAVFLVLPSQVRAADLLRKDSRKYTANSSIMGLATQTSPDDSKESPGEKADRQTLLKANQATDKTDAYTIEKSATLSKTTKEITYQFIIKSKTPSIESDKKENIYAIFALNNNTDLTDIKVDKVTSLDDSGKEINAAFQVENPGIFVNDSNISTLGIRTEKQANDLLYYLSAKVDDEAIAKIEKGDYSPIFALDMVLANNEKKAIYENRYSLEVNKYTEEVKSDDRLSEIIEEEKLEEVEESKSLIKGEYSPESNGLFATNPATITWTDYILSTDEKEFVYDIDLDKAQETENSEISVEFYEAKENGFILNNSFSQKLPFANSIKLQIPKGQLARITLTTTINKEANAKEFTYNGKILANPDYKEDATEESKKEERASDDPDPLPEPKEESKDQPNTPDKEKAESDKTKITLEADPETNEVLVDPDLIKEEKADQKEEDYSAIDLNRDSVIKKFQEGENTDPVMEIAINNIASLFSDYNKEAISYDDFLASLKEQSKSIDKEDFREITTGLLAGINKDKYKVANIEIDNLLDDIYGKESITEVIEEKEPESSSIENNTDDDIPTQTIDQNFETDSLDTKNKADSLSPEEKDKQKALESFDKALDQVKEESKKPQDDDRSFIGNISEGIKGIFGQSNFNKADKELKAALAEGKSLEEIQTLLLELGEKYELNRKDEARLMSDNEDAIKGLIAKDADKNFRPNILMAQNADGISPLNDKKFTIRTRFDTSTATGAIQDYQFFKIHLDKKLTVKDPSSLKPITYDGRVIARPSYDKGKNEITYNIEGTIPENIQVPLEIPVDYNTDNITPGQDFTVTNRISGLGVTNPKELPPEKIDQNGNPAGTIIELGDKDVVKIIDPLGGFYKFDMDANSSPEIDNGELKGYNWTIRVTSDTDLNALGYKINFTTVNGSGLGEISSRDTSINLEDQLKGAFGLVDSKHHEPGSGLREITYNLYTPITDKQASYMLDISVMLSKKDKVGAQRIVAEEGYPDEMIERMTPTRVSMNNRTSIKGEFASNTSAKWTITDGVSTNDTNNGLPLATRELGNQTFASGKTATYGLDDSGKMVAKNPESNLTSLPEAEENPAGSQAVGNIAVYEVDTKLNNQEALEEYSVSGVRISKYRDLYVDQKWGLPKGFEDLPAQTLTVRNKAGDEVLGTANVDPSTGYSRAINIQNVKYWDIASDGTATMIDHKIEQTFNPETVMVDGKNHKYVEQSNHYNYNERNHYIYNRLDEITNKVPGTFTIIKVDSKNPENRLSGAKYYLLGSQIEVTTDANGEATFSNIKPGTYTLKETQAPAGYKLDQEDKYITIADDGSVSVSGNNAQYSSGTGKTEIVEHSDYPNWPDFMNTQHYGKIDSEGKLDFYLYLKPYDKREGGRTDKDTTLNISIPGVNLTDSNITVYDVDGNQRSEIFAAMNSQSVDNKLSGLHQVTLGADNNGGIIEGHADTPNPLSGVSGYQLNFPEGRFGTDWGFLVKVSANIDNKNSTVLSYDWLAKADPQGQSKIRQNVNLSKNSDENGHPSITITNEAYKKSNIEVAKYDSAKNKLPGAEFELKNSNGKVIANKTTKEEGEEEGKANFGKFPPGTYYLEESKAPAGYEKSNVYFEVTVDESGKVTYKAKFKDSDASPVAGADYYIKRIEGGEDKDPIQIKSVDQEMLINDKKGRGFFTGIWEAYRLESLKWTLDAKLANVGPGKTLEIQFDQNLDFTQYFKTFPNIEFQGKVIAEPHFDYKTNLLTYVFNDKSKSDADTSIHVELEGMIPSKFYQLETGQSSYKTIVAPGKKGEDTITLDVPAYYESHDNHVSNPYDPTKQNALYPSQSYYFRDIYKADDGQWYVKAIAYYNPLGNYNTKDNKANNKVYFNWIFTDWSEAAQPKWVGKYEAPFDLRDVKVYKTDFPGVTKAYPIKGNYDKYAYVNKNMPLSYGVVPENDPNTYELVFSSPIDPNARNYYNSEGDISLKYSKNNINPYSKLTFYKDAPLELTLPEISPRQEGYVIEQTFSIRDIDAFNSHWRAFSMTNGNLPNNDTSLKSTFINSPNPNIAHADQVGVELPKTYEELVGIINKKYEPGSFTITKLNGDTKATLPGASFILIDENNNSFIRTSDANGQVVFKDLATGKYKLREYKAPKNFKGSNEEWQVTVYRDGNVKIESQSITGGGTNLFGENLNIEVENKPSGQDFRIYKKNDEGKGLAGAEFTLTKQVKAGEEPSTPIVRKSNAQGIVSFEDLKPGTYEIKETRAPEGYKPTNKKWALVIDEKGKKQVYNYSLSDGKEELSLLDNDANTYRVNVKDRPQDKWGYNDNRITGWTNKSTEAKYLGTRIIAINKDKNYVIQRYVLNPQAENLVDGVTSATIHREKPSYTNMDWYNGNEEYKVFTLGPKEGGNADGKVTGFISDLRLADYTVTDITDEVKKSAKTVTPTTGDNRLQLTFPKTDKPIVVDVKIPYKYESQGVGTGMDLRENNSTYWKSDYYESVSDIKTEDKVSDEKNTIVGSYIGDDSLDVTNEQITYNFKIKKVRQADQTKPIQGAVFKLTGPQPNTDERYMTSGTDGMIAFNNLKPGIYKLEETEPAPGYQKPDTDWQVTITRDGKAYIKANNPNAETTSTLVKDEKSISKLKSKVNKTNDGLEIGDDLVGSPLRAGTGVTYDIINTISDITKKYVKVSTNAKYLGNDVFLVRIDVKGNQSADRSDVTFDLQLHDDVTFVPNSTITWKENANDKDQVPDNPSRWHSGYDPNTKKIGVRDGAISINKGDTASMEFKVTMNSNLNVGQTGYIINSLKVYNIDCGKLAARKFDAYTIHQNVQNGTITTDPINYQRNGQPVTFTVTPNPGYKLVGNVTVTNDSNGRDVPTRNGNTFTMPANDVTINATFEANTYKINKATTIKNGFVNIASSARTDEEVSFIVTPESGYKIEKLTYTDQDGKEQTIELDKLGNGSFTMPPVDTTINATFKKLAYKIHVTNKTPEFGKVGKLTEAESGKSVTINPTPNDGYQVGPIKVTRIDTGAEVRVTGTTFIMPESDVNVEVSFKKKPPQVFNIKVNNGANGSVSVEPTSSIAGQTIKITVSPDNDYQLDQLKVTEANGKDVTVTNNSFTMPKSNVIVSAAFKEKPITPPEGSIEIPEDGFATITNKQTGLDLQIVKKDKNGRPLKDAEFTLAKYTNDTYETLDGEFTTVTVKSDENGKVNLVDSEGKPINLQTGYYRLTEVQSPLGFKKAQAPWDIKVYEEKGQLKAVYKSADYSDYDYVNSYVSYDKKGLQTTNDGIKVKSKLTYINTESKTYVQRIYIDTRGYKGNSNKVNIQITPKHKREEIDAPGKLPITYEEGVKTAYRTTYKITGDPTGDENAFANEVLEKYDLSRNNVRMINTARWRPFDWGFDEDIMNLDAGRKNGGIYFIDVEGFYDDAIITGMAENEVDVDKKNKYQYTTDSNGNPTKKAPYRKTEITDDDLKKLDLNIDFYDGPRYFQQLIKNKNGQIVWSKGTNVADSYLGGNITLGYAGTDENGATNPTKAGREQANTDKYPKWIGKTAGQIYPALTNGTRVETRIDLSGLYVSDKFTKEVPRDGMTILNDKESYNITFSKHGRKNSDDDINSEAVTNNRLEGAIFRLEKELGSGIYVPVEGSYVGSAFNGYFGFRGLEPGRYRLIEVQAPEGYNPINGPLLYFTIKTVNANSGEVVDPETGETIDIKVANIRFKTDGTIYKLSELKMEDPKDPTKVVDINNVDSKDINIETAKIVNPETNEHIALKDLIVVGEKKFDSKGKPYWNEYPIKDIKIVPKSSGYISLEYDEANGVYQYVPEKTTSEKDGKLIDFVTSATAKNMGKIINEVPAEGKVIVTKVDQDGNNINGDGLTVGAKFRLTRLTAKEDKEGEETKASIQTKVVDSDGKIVFDNLPIGNYRLEEIESPDGYINTGQVWHFTIGGEGIDPYSGPIARNGRDLSDQIILESSEMKVINPDTVNNQPYRKGEVHPHLGESMEFTNKFKLAKGIKINPGDYFTLKMSGQIDLNGIFEYEIENLDIFADGVGTIAKADYDRDARTITYTFTDYAKTYELIDFSNKLTAFIDLYWVPNSDGIFSSQKVGFGIKVPGQSEDTSQYKDIKVVYDLDYGQEYDQYGNGINMVSKIVKYNPKTGEFLHYFYINRKKTDSDGPIEWRYTSNQNIANLKISYTSLVNNYNVANDMPESFGVNENSGNLYQFRTPIYQNYLSNIYYKSIYFEDGLTAGRSLIIKVTGRVADLDKSQYYAEGNLYRTSDNCYCAPLYAHRHDEIRYFKNEAKARVEQSIKAVNPENMIDFTKFDQEGNTLAGATFQLQTRKTEQDEWVDVEKPITTTSDGEFGYTKLKPGQYQLLETNAPTGYKNEAGPVATFKVDDKGRIVDIKSDLALGHGFQQSQGSTGKKTIPIVNKKEHEIEFKKVDADNKQTTLANAEFEVWYKASKDVEYTNDRKLYQNEAGDKIVLMADETAPEGYTPVDKFTTGADGLVKFKFYEPGYYALKEIKAPDGYMTPTEPVYEFRLENGKVQVLKNNIDKVTTKDGYLESQVLEVDKEKKTFKQRIIINPKHLMKFKAENSYLRVAEDGWKVDSVKFGSIKSNDANNAIKYSDSSYSPKVIGSDKIYYLKDIYDFPTSIGTIVVQESKVIEITGTIDEGKTRADITTDLIFEDTSVLKEENITFTIDPSKDKSQQSAYTNVSNTKPIEITNKKPTYPSTGGTGTKIAFAIIGTAVMLAAIAYFGIFQNDKNRRRSARYKK